MNTGVVIDAHGIGKSYGSRAERFAALKGVSVQIRDGETVAIVGKSGSGKSTLMHILALLDRPDAGKLRIADRDAQALSVRELNTMRNAEFGFVFQQFFLIPSASVLENVILPLKIAGVASAERRRRGLDALEQFGLADKASSRANDLSGGQKQRVVISRALINNPRIIFADEPTGNLDSATGQVVEDTLFSLNRTRGITLILVTHDEELAARCDRQVLLRDGVVIAPGATSATKTTGADA